MGRPLESESTQSEWTLLQECRQGSLAAFERLYQAHGSRMKSIAFNLLRNPSDAEDAVQEAFLKIYRGVGEFRADSSFSTWIYRILVNACYDLVRKRQRRQESPVAEEETLDRRPAESSDHPLRLTLESCLARLNERTRNVFLLFEVEGFKHKEIAEILDIREGTSKALLFEAKRELQKWLKRA